MATYKKRRYLLQAVDPIHIGTGGHRLGGVDNSIVREPGSNIPKIPGTSLHGSIRSHTARIYGTPEAAGQSPVVVLPTDQESNPGNAPASTKRETNPINYTFGYLDQTTNAAGATEHVGYSGLVSIFDALILFFPLYSAYGPVWATTPQRLLSAGFTTDPDPVPPLDLDTIHCSWDRQDPLNLGHLQFAVSGEAVQITPPTKWQNLPEWTHLQDRITLVSDRVFTHLVNSNLEVRTSVSIDPFRGAAAEGLLFTYEAIPAATVFTSDVVLDDYRSGNGTAFPATTRTAQDEPLPGRTGQSGWNNPLDVVDAGMHLLAWFGVGGMGTRGFGRLGTLGEPLEQSLDQERLS